MLDLLSERWNEFTVENSGKLKGIITEYISICEQNNHPVPEFLSDLLNDLNEWKNFRLQDLEVLLDKIKNEFWWNMEMIYEIFGQLSIETNLNTDRMSEWTNLSEKTDWILDIIKEAIKKIYVHISWDEII